MFLFKRLSVMLAAAAACTLLAAAAMTVNAEPQSLSDTDDLAVQASADIPEPVTKDDAGYYKFLERSQKSENYAENLVHQSRFNNYQKINGIDVSYYQSDIDWAKVKASGIEFAIIRAGYRGYGSAGTLVQDPSFYTYLRGAKAAGVKVGVYFYTQAINTAEAQAEAQFVLDMLGGASLDMPIYYDIEGVDYDTGRLDSAGLSVEQKTNLCRAFCNKIISAGYQSGVYANYSWLTYVIDGASLSKSYPIWVAHYNYETWWTNAMEMWQYSGTGIVPGINTYTDMNVWYTTGNFITTTLTGSVTDCNTASLSWKKGTGAARYDIYRLDSSGSNEVKLASTTSLSANVPLDLYNAQYYVKMYNSSNAYIGMSNKIKLQGGTVTSLAKSAVTANSLTMTWDPVSSATGYVLYAKKADGSESYTRRGYVYTNSGTVSDLPTGTKYTFCIRPFYNPAGKKAWTDDCVLGPVSNSVSELLEAGRITSVSLKGATENTISIGWSPLKAVTGYRVYIKKNEDGAKFTRVADITASSYTYTGLDVRTQYIFVVRPLYGSVLGQLSNELLASTVTPYPVSIISDDETVASRSITAKLIDSTGKTRFTMYSKNGYINLPVNALTLLGGEFTLRISATGCVTRDYTVTIKDKKFAEDFSGKIAVLGDVNMDGTINTLDVMRLKAALINYSPLNDYQALLADLNADGEVNTLDVMALKAKLLGL